MEDDDDLHSNKIQMMACVSCWMSLKISDCISCFSPDSHHLQCKRNIK